MTKGRGKGTLTKQKGKGMMTKEEEKGQKDRDKRKRNVDKRRGILTKEEEKERCEGQRKAALPGAPKKEHDIVKMTLRALPTPQPPAHPREGLT